MQLISFCEIQNKIPKKNPKNNPKQKSKNDMQLERAPNRGSFKLGSKNAAKIQHKMSCS
jgi:hypothetical protein